MGKAGTLASDEGRSMDFEYDFDKSQRNEIERGISFEYAALIFTWPDSGNLG